MDIRQDFNDFSAVDYLTEYYSQIGSENEFLLQFFKHTYNKLKPTGRLLEVGGGPVILPLISATTYVDEIIFSEYNPVNRAAVEDWLNEAPGCFNWDHYFQFVFETDANSETDWTTAKDLLRSKIKKVIPYDAYQNPPISEARVGFDIASVNFCFESITATEADYLAFYDNLIPLLNAGGLLIGSALKEADYYHVGDANYPAFPINETYLAGCLEAKGFKDISISTVPAEAEQGYGGLMTFYCFKR